MMFQIAAFITSLTVALLMFPLVIKYLHHWQLTDKPGRRKIHKGEKPSFGGIPVFVSFIFSALVWINLTEWKHVKFMLLAQIIIIFFGLRDDLAPLKPVHKLVGQILAASIIIFLFELRITSLFGFMGLHEIPQVVSYFITFVVIVAVTNSFNLIDGIDGLAGTVAGIVFLTLGVWFYLVGDKIFSITSFALLGGLVGFLFFNWQPSKIFMGDTGSLFLGVTLSMFVIHFMNTNESLPVENPYKFMNTIAAALCFLMPPVVDTLRVIIIRLTKGHSPFRPDKNHIHHVFIRLGLPHHKATLIIAGVQLTFIAIAILLSGLTDLYALPIFIGLAITFSIILDRLIISYAKSGKSFFL